VPPGSFDTFTVRVPTEKDEPTVKVRIEFPAGLLVSRFQPKPGWKRDVEKDPTGRIVAVTWSGGQIAPDEYEDFAFLARAPNQPGILTFKAFQTYQSGDTVNWVEAEDGENPAPVVQVTNNPAPGATQQLVESPAAGATATTGSAAATATVEVNASPAPEASPTVEAGPSSTPDMAAMEMASPSATAEASSSPNDAGGLSTTAGSTGASRGSDLPLFVSLGALILALIALALGGIAVARRGGGAA
jgi:uncharacterized protein YcnI